MADNFTFGADKKIVVALEHDVMMANKRDMLKVSRHVADWLNWSLLLRWAQYS